MILLIFTISSRKITEKTIQFANRLIHFTKVAFTY